MLFRLIDLIDVESCVVDQLTNKSHNRSEMTNEQNMYSMNYCCELVQSVCFLSLFQVLMFIRTVIHIFNIKMLLCLSLYTRQPVLCDGFSNNCYEY